jgi:hypothetical protein
VPPQGAQLQLSRTLQVKLSLLLPTTKIWPGLRFALDSLLECSAPDFEVICSVATGSELVASAIRSDFPHPKLRVCVPEIPLSHAAHWEFLLKQARGQWIALITDRTVLRADWWSTISPLLSSARILTYKSLAVLGAQAPWLVQTPWFSGQSKHEKSSTWISAARECRFAESGPYLLNSIVHISVINRIRSQLGRVCGDFVGDCGFYSSCLAMNMDWLHIDRPLVAMHSAESGIGSALVRGQQTPASESLLDEIRRGGGLSQTPLPQVISNMNIRVHELASATARAGHQGFEVNPVDYARTLLQEMRWQSHTDSHNAKELVERYALSHCIHVPATSNLRTWRPAVRSVVLRVAGPGTSPFHRKLNLPVARFEIFQKAIAFVTDDNFPPNRRFFRSISWS